MAKKELEIKDIPAALALLSQRVGEIETHLLNADHWISPYECEVLIPFTRTRILQWINRAEQARALGNPTTLLYGEHYVNTSDTSKPAWKVHRIKFCQWALQPPENR